jgi:DNA polymerase III epsilon subunit-like protein
MGYAMQKIVPVDMNELRNGKYFVDTITEYKKWCGKDFIFATWGPLDISQLHVNMEYYNIPLFSKKPLPFLDVQKLFSIEYEDKKTRRTLEYAVDFLHISKDIPFHRAFSDAYYTAKVLELIRKRDTLEHLSYDIYTPAKTKHDEIRIMFSDYYKYISKEFPNKRMALQEKEVKEMRCYICGKKVKKDIGWFFPNMKHGYCVYKCEKHGYVKGKIRIKHSNDEKVYIVKTIRMITEKEKQEILDKLKKLREQRRKKPGNN